MNVRMRLDGDKVINRGQKGAWSHRCHAAVLRFNNGISWVEDFLHGEYNISSGARSENFFRASHEKKENDVRLQQSHHQKGVRLQRKYSKKELKEHCKDYGPNCKLLESDLPRDLLLESMEAAYAELPSVVSDTTQGSHEWITERKKRVTSSNFGRICKRRLEDPSGLVKSLLYSTFSGNEATNYGHRMEKIMEETVKERNPGITITHPSLTVDTSNKFLAGSPDGVATFQGTDFLLEYKAPYSLYVTEEPARSAKFITKTGQLNSRHDYFYQIQGLLHIFDLPFCMLVVAGFDDFYFVRVDRDNEFFLEKMFYKLRTFYFGALLPEVVFPMKRRLGLRKAYVEFE